MAHLGHIKMNDLVDAVIKVTPVGWARHYCSQVINHSSTCSLYIIMTEDIIQLTHRQVNVFGSFLDSSNSHNHSAIEGSANEKS